MNARQLPAVALFFAAAVLSLPKNSPASEWPYFFADPLHTMPPVIEKGATLPGDSLPIPRSMQIDFSRTLGLAEALDLALSNNESVKMSWADIKIQAGVLGEAYAAYLPTISGSLNYTKDYIFYFDSKYGTTQNNKFTPQASISWRLFDFGGRLANRRSAENLLAAALVGHDYALQDVAGKVIKAYFDALIANASFTAKVKDEEIARHTLNSAKFREEMGVISQSDALRATTALATASLEKNRAHSEYRKALAVLRVHLGLPGNAPLRLPEDLNEQQGSDVGNKELPLWLEEAQKNHPVIVRARKQYEAAQEQVTVTKSAGLPEVTISGNYYMNTAPGGATTSGSYETTVIVGMTMPLFDGFASTYKLRGAQAQVERKKAALAETEEQVAMEIVKAYADTDSARLNLDSSSIIISSAQSALAVSQRKYDKGAADITELLSTQTALTDAWNVRVRCLAEWHSARLQLLVSAGKMGRYAVKN
jgi:outer membrane protein